jgi:hypothetical protein
MPGPNSVPLCLDELFWEKTRSQIGLRGWALKSASNAITLLLFHPLVLHHCIHFGRMKCLQNQRLNLEHRKFASRPTFLTVFFLVSLSFLIVAVSVAPYPVVGKSCVSDIIDDLVSSDPPPQ